MWVDGLPMLTHLVPVRLAPLLALLILMSACGGSTQAAPTRAEFISKGDAVCAEIQQELVPLRARADAARSLPQSEQLKLLKRMWDDQIRIHERFVDDMKEIGTPAGDTVAQGLIDSLEDGVKLAEDVQDGFEDEDAAAIGKALPAYLNYTVMLNGRVADYGFRRCGASS